MWTTSQEDDINWPYYCMDDTRPRQGRHRNVTRILASLFILAVVAVGGMGVAAARAAAAPPIRFISVDDVRRVLKELADILPVELQVLPNTNADARWSAWIADHDAHIRARLAQGDEDTLLNWLLFGTSFTSEPRAVLDQAAASDRQALVRMTDLVGARADDLLTALQSPGDDGRRVFARRFFEGNGFSLATPAGVAELRAHLLMALQRVAVEQSVIAQDLAEARNSGDIDAELAVRSTLYQTRGLSLDTSLAVNFAIEQALATVKKQGLLKAGTVKRVAIVGAGLDFADRDVGLDTYPQQTVQPFAVIDSLRKLQLAPATALPEVVVLDISPRVLDHIAQVRDRASSGGSYTLTLPLSERQNWLPAFRDYWKTFGTRIGAPVAGATNQAAVRTVRIPPAVVQRISATDLDIVAERIDGAAFDLIIATNVLVYYGALDHELAAANIEAMLRPGGILLSNTALPEMEAVPIELMDSSTVRYTRGEDSDQILWYRRTM